MKLNAVHRLRLVTHGSDRDGRRPRHRHGELSELLAPTRLRLRTALRRAVRGVVAARTYRPLAMVGGGIVAGLGTFYHENKTGQLTPNAVKAILEYTAVPLPGDDVLSQGAGSLNPAGALRFIEEKGLL